MAIELALARRIIKMSKTSQLESLKRVLIDQELWKCWERNRSIIRQQAVIGKKLPEKKQQHLKRLTNPEGIVSPDAKKCELGADPFCGVVEIQSRSG